MLSKMKFLMWLASASVLVSASVSPAVTLGFVEDFTTNVASWEDNVNNPLTFVASGGVDGGSYASTSFNYFGFVDPFGGGGPVTFRASFADNPSGGAFVGDYLTEGVGAIKVSFRTNAPVSLNLFMRVANQFNFPGAVMNQAVSVPANTWTEILFPIDPNSPLCTGETIPCSTAFANVQNLQFGTDAPLGLTTDNTAYTLDIDRVTIMAAPVPEPGTALLMGLGLAGLCLPGRRKARA